MKLIKEGIKEVSSVHSIVDNKLYEIKDIYSIIGGQLLKVWTAIKDFISSVFGQGFWQNSEGWNNKDLWLNKP